VWWVAGDSLVIYMTYPTEESLSIWTAQPDREDPAEWAGQNLVSTPGRGHVSLRRYKCNMVPAAGS
jgi:hypothetical protein